MTDTAISNSYITTDTIFETYLTGDPRTSAIALKAASSDVQAWYLKKATQKIDNLALKGTTYYEFVNSSPGSGQQDRQFPRYIDGMCFGWNVNTLLPEVPKEVLDACCEEAIALYDIQNSPDKRMRLDLQRQGVTSANYGGTSEQFSQNPSGSISGAGNRYKGLMSKEAYDLLKGYIAGAIEASFS